MPRLEIDLVSIDANVAADFAVVGRLDILGTLFSGRLLASDFVVAELARAGIAIDGAEIVGLPGEDLGLFQSLRDQHRNLGLGELGTICVAKLRKAVVLTNDKEARKLAVELGVEVSGTLGVLKHTVTMRFLTGSDAIQLLDRMIEDGSWFGPDLVEEFKCSLR